MTIAAKEAEIVRVRKSLFAPGLSEALEAQLQAEVTTTVQVTIEEALIEEVEAHRNSSVGPKPRRSGYYERELNTQYGRIEQLRVPKLRAGNRERDWRILTRYQRALSGLLDDASYLYILGLSLRDLQVCFYQMLGRVLSRSAINQVTLRMQARMDNHRQQEIVKTPPIIIVDGVWVDIQYTLDEFKVDRAGHRRQARQAQERVILAAMAVWPDGTRHLLHYRVSATEDGTSWRQFFDEMIARGLDPQAIELVVSDGSKGLLEAMRSRFPAARQQRCITHKVRGMAKHLTFGDLAAADEAANPLSEKEAKALRRYQIQHDAYEIYNAPSLAEAQARLTTFLSKWEPIEPKAVRNFRWGGKRTFEFYRFPAELHVHIRTTNALERLFREFRTKSDEIGAFPNEDSCLTLFFMIFKLDHAKHDRPFVANTS